MRRDARITSPSRRAAAAQPFLSIVPLKLPAYLADHLRANREALAAATLLNVVCGRPTEWTAPGL